MGVLVIELAWAEFAAEKLVTVVVGLMAKGCVKNFTPKLPKLLN